MIKKNNITKIGVRQYRNGDFNIQQDLLCTEEPLEFRLPFYLPSGETVFKTLAITMRTPGNDRELATGFLYSEGIISSASDIESFHYSTDKGEAGNHNSLKVNLKESLSEENQQLERRFTTYSSCGLCGKTSIQSLELQNPPSLDEQQGIVDIELLKDLSDVMKQEQVLFKKTGAAHGAGLFDTSGNLIKICEDTGRHNALDKLIGYCITHNVEQLAQSILLVSGRTSFELVQKSIMAGIPILISVGAPSSLAVETAQRFNLTLLGFLSNGGFNIYNAGWRLKNTEEN